MSYAVLEDIVVVGREGAGQPTPNSSRFVCGLDGDRVSQP